MTRFSRASSPSSLLSGPSLLVTLPLFVLLLMPTPARANEAGHGPNVASRSSTGPQDEADDPCEGNRRCRLQRFRMQQSARRAAQIEREIREEEAKRQARVAALTTALPVRQVKKVEIGAFINANPTFGRGFRGAFGDGTWRGEVQLAWMDLYGWDAGRSLNSNGLTWTGRARWTLGKEQGALYLAAGASLMDLTVFSSGIFEPGSDEWTGGGMYRGRVHAATVALGFDFLARIGFHAGLEVQYAVPFYVRVRDADGGAYDDGLTRALRNGIQERAFGVSVTGGWGF